ncbi:hypothetical protein HF313_22065 [Massilia atriviolacea]|uniref:DUF2268 domain-containing protein n=1 Tax=Massilia atriviolacea TaxID=2495579 RepID=A0A430HFG6_9BURK|nr:DUF2268 domain-containing putative Zn-dependent protease [Massilia atriviolacea]RSZ56253.1 hypothetical protein EJB06_25500 [Massilia atriviolacea]
MKQIVFFHAIALAAALCGPALAQTSGRAWASAADVARDGHKPQAALEAYRKAAASGYASMLMDLKYAATAAKLGHRDEALGILEQAGAKRAFRLLDDLAQEDDFAPLRGDARWAGIVAAAGANERAYRAAHASPEDFRFITSDIARFWTVYDKLDSAAEPGALLERDYLDAGSAGLHGFVHMRIVSGDSLARRIGKHPAYYRAIRPHTLRVAALEPAIRADMRRFKALYPAAMFPDIYFVIGRLSAGGTASPEGLLIGAEMFGRGPGVPTEELSAWLQAGTADVDKLPAIVAHELMHFQQRLDPQTLLEHAIKEGSCDFLASLVSTGQFNEPVYRYGYANEAQLKTEFLAAMDGTDFKRWLYSGAPEGDRPADLGYFMGFRITEAYYKQARDKRQAIAEILHISDFKRFLAESGYAAPARR